MPTATEEMLRYSAPVMYFRRTATADTALGGKDIKQGDARGALVHQRQPRRDPLRGAGRVPGRPHPERAHRVRWPWPALLPRRQPRPLGDQQALRRRCSPASTTSQLAGDVQRLRSNFINGIKHMPVTFDAGKKIGS